MERLLFTHGNVITEHEVIEDGYVTVENGKIVKFGKGCPDPCTDYQVINCQGHYISPGLIDIHVHGGGGHDFMDGTVDAIVGAARSHLYHGTTTMIPTTLTCSDEELYLFFDNYKIAKKLKENMPNLGGIHLEGPYFSPVQAGAQPSEYMLSPHPEHYMPILSYAGEDIVRWSFAPELEGGITLLDELNKRGIMASAGHTNATYQEMVSATGHGLKHVTHLYSGMSTISRKNGHRILGVVESAYLIDELTVEVIADGIHIPPELMRLILKCKDHDSICLVTDSMRGAGMPDGPSILGSKKNGLNVMIENGIANMPDHSGFAGSVATADRLIRVMVEQAGLPLEKAIHMMSATPAKFLGIDNAKGSIRSGMDADLIVFDTSIAIHRVFVMGTEQMIK